MEKKEEVEIIVWKRVRILGKIRFGLVSLAFSNHHSALIALKSFKISQEDDILLYNLLLTLEQSWKQKQGMRGTKRYMAPESLLNQEL
ncbi:hypothetical protein H5410_032998 [Solanum commersonii]|uniref:Uncharacterized protein n=1 Tax=Solanum commersonii TaxID=4109 RepID=A0A9J5YR98_SOLCO|nr:hypothetical protein H5410_032998 [Solanum commersonii]